MDDTGKAVAEYQRRVRAANATIRGADHKQIMAEVSEAHGLTPLTLINAVNFDEIMGPN